MSRPAVKNSLKQVFIKTLKTLCSAEKLYVVFAVHHLPEQLLHHLNNGELSRKLAERYEEKKEIGWTISSRKKNHSYPHLLKILLLVLENSTTVPEKLYDRS
ncbi:hypothetical protein NPIL_646191 [Nephila pilipes]|uniref:Uncharacterized protein n=1 Tax=Nephila pilipes TaxID=299642 RepID=A0A8X6TWT3_NEPPI|nr:hypothetical protein NPIL_646191 [Nephila pilipes]